MNKNKELLNGLETELLRALAIDCYSSAGRRKIKAIKAKIKKIKR